MRYGFAVVCLWASACASESELRYTSTLQAETRGVALSEDGLDSFAAMSGVTCTIDTNWGCPTEDVDLPTTEERLTDHWNGQTVGVSAQGVHVIDHGVWLGDADREVSEVRTAALSEVGEVVVSGSGETCQVQFGADEPMLIDAAACAEGARYSVDRATGHLYASSPEGLVEVRSDRSRILGQGTDLADFDQSLHLLYTAVQGDRDLRALNMDGEEVWKVTTGGAIQSLAARGNRGEVMVLVDRPSGLAAIERREGESGRLLGTSAVPTSDGVLDSSDNGRTIAVIRLDEVNFFALDFDTEPVVDETPPNCIVPTAPGQEVNLGD
jgi:hypothetical protein